MFLTFATLYKIFNHEIEISCDYYKPYILDKYQRYNTVLSESNFLKQAYHGTFVFYSF